MANERTPTDEEIHALNKRLQQKEKLDRLTLLCNEISDLMNEHFDPPNLMAWRGERGWHVFIRREDSDTEFGPSEWSPENTEPTNG